MARLSVNLPPSLHQQARIKAIQDGRALSVIVRDWLFDWVAEPLDGQGAPAKVSGIEPGPMADDVARAKADPQHISRAVRPDYKGPITKADQAKGKTRKKR